MSAKKSDQMLIWITLFLLVWCVFPWVAKWATQPTFINMEGYVADKIGDGYGMLNALATGIGTIVLLYSLLHQKQQLEDNATDFQRSLQAMVDDTEASMFVAIHDLLQCKDARENRRKVHEGRCKHEGEIDLLGVSELKRNIIEDVFWRFDSAATIADSGKQALRNKVMRKYGEVARKLVGEARWFLDLRRKKQPLLWKDLTDFVEEYENN